MRGVKSDQLSYAESRRPELKAKVYDFGARHAESSRLQRIKALERENALLTRVASEIGTEMVRLRKLLAGQ